jgi:hypothetical protein
VTAACGARSSEAARQRARCSHSFATSRRIRLVSKCVSTAANSRQPVARRSISSLVTLATSQRAARGFNQPRSGLVPADGQSWTRTRPLSGRPDAQISKSRSCGRDLAAIRLVARCVVGRRTPAGSSWLCVVPPWRPCAPLLLPLASLFDHRLENTGEALGCRLGRSNHSFRMLRLCHPVSRALFGAGLTANLGLLEKVD